MAPMMGVDPYWVIAKGSEKFKLNLRDLERAEENAQHGRAVGWKSRRWLWMTVFLVVVVVGLFVLYQVTGASEAALPTR